MVFKKEDLLELDLKITKEDKLLYIYLKQDYIIDYIKLYIDEKELWINKRKFLIEYGLGGGGF